MEPENEDEELGKAYQKAMVSSGEMSPSKSIKNNDLSIVEEKPTARFVVVKKLSKDKQTKAQ